jgi:hypothetical protein
LLKSETGFLLHFMRIGKEDGYLLIEAISLGGGVPAFKVEAVSSASGRRFTASHDRLIMDRGEATFRNFADFESLKSGQFETEFTEGGWLRFQRDSRGCVTVKYRIGGWKAAAAMEGEVLVEGEFANSFCREFGALLRS